MQRAEPIADRDHDHDQRRRGSMLFFAVSVVMLVAFALVYLAL